MTVTGAAATSRGKFAVADPRVRHKGSMGVLPWEAPSGTVTGESLPSNGAHSVADPRLGCEPRAGAYGVAGWDEPAGTVTGSARLDNSTAAVADPRVGTKGGQFSPNAHRNKFVVKGWAEPAPTVIGATRPGSGGPSVADPRVALKMGPDAHHNVLRVTPWDDPAGTVTGAPRPSNGAGSVADPRGPQWFGNVLRVVPWGKPTGTVTHSPAPSSGAIAVADPRVKVSETWDRGACLGVVPFDKPFGTITAGTMPGQGAYSVADIRVDKAALIGIITLADARATVTGALPVPFAVVDPSSDGPPVMVIADVGKAPPAAPVILAADGTWHRPLTTLELAVLQGLPAVHRGAPLLLTGTSSSDWRERIGNAVPVQAATAIAEQMLLTLLSSDMNAFSLSSGGGVWVAPEQESAAFQ